MSFKIGANVFVHADGQVKFIPEEGGSAGLPFSMRAKAFSGEHNGKAIALKGNTILPVTVALAEAEPSFSVGLDVMQMSIDLAEHVGDGYARIPYQIIVTYSRPRLAPVSFILNKCIIEKGFGFKSESGGAASDEISGKCREILMKYKGRTYDPYKLPGGALEI